MKFWIEWILGFSDFWITFIFLNVVRTYVIRPNHYFNSIYGIDLTMSFPLEWYEWYYVDIVGPLKKRMPYQMNTFINNNLMEICIFAKAFIYPMFTSSILFTMFIPIDPNFTFELCELSSFTIIIYFCLLLCVLNLYKKWIRLNHIESFMGTSKAKWFIWLKSMNFLLIIIQCLHDKYENKIGTLEWFCCL